MHREHGLARLPCPGVAQLAILGTRRAAHVAVERDAQGEELLVLLGVGEELVRLCAHRHHLVLVVADGAPAVGVADVVGGHERVLVLHVDNLLGHVLVVLEPPEQLHDHALGRVTRPDAGGDHVEEGGAEEAQRRLPLVGPRE